MKRRIISIIISVFFVLAMLEPTLVGAAAVSDVWTGTQSTPALSGGVYQISTGEQLSWFANSVNNGNTSIKGALTQDIRLNYDNATANVWVPIGTEASPFSGSFNGNNYTVSGVYINSTSDYQGLFGYISSTEPASSDDSDSSDEVAVVTVPTVISNVNVTLSSITGGQGTGGICGYSHYSEITGCSYSGTVSGGSSYNSVGGILGWGYNFAKVSKSKSSGTVTGNQRVGGIVGFQSINNTITQCYSSADVSGVANIGGLCGTGSSSLIENSYFIGTAAAGRRVGGILGNSAYETITSCYELGRVSADNTDYCFAVIGYSFSGTYDGCYYCYDVSGVMDKNGTAKTASEMKKLSFVRLLNSEGNSFSYDYTAVNNGYPVLSWSLDTSLWSGGIETASKNTSGAYVIDTAAKLAWFERLVNGTLSGVTQDASANAVVTKDILLNIYVDDSEDTNKWTAIGTEATPYLGTFDGGGYNIAGVYINDSSVNNLGLFGYIGSSSVVENVVLIDGLICGGQNIGGVVGYNKGGTVQSCCSNTTVTGNKAVGGIVGWNSTSSTITGCYTLGTVSGLSETDGQVGGIVGYNTRGTITQCYNNGTVTNAGNYCGGIAGFNTGNEITMCYNTGTVKGYYYVGGAIGYLTSGTITNSYNAGVVTGTQNVNNFVGFISGTCTVTNCYYDTNIENTITTDTSGAVLKDTASMTGVSSLTNLGFSASYWYVSSNSSYYYYYPQIKVLATSSYDKFKKSSLQSVTKVQDIYSVQVVTEGEPDSYYQTLPQAVSAIGSGRATVIVLKSQEVSSTISVSGDITICVEDASRSVTKASGFTASLFDVTGKLTLGLGLDEYVLDFNGSGNVNNCLGNVVSTQALITVEDSGTLVTLDGTKIYNSKTTTVNGALVNILAGGTMNMNGGTLSDGSTTKYGGAVAVQGTFKMTDGTIQNSTASISGGGIYNISGSVAISGGKITGNIAKGLYGGGLYTAGGDVTISSNADINANTSNNSGAGIGIAKGCSVTMSGGTIQNNAATLYGGGIYNNGGTFVMTGGSITSNTSGKSLGDGVYVGGTAGVFEIKGTSLVSGNVYLKGTNKITVTGRLNTSGTVATITPETYSTDTVVLDGDFMPSSYTKFAVTPQSSTNWYINALGKIVDTEVTPVASLSKIGSSTSEFNVLYTSLADAVEAVKSGETGIITMIGNDSISRTISVAGDVTIKCDDSTAYTAMRSGSFTGDLFKVTSGAELRFGSTSISYYDTSGTDSDTSFILDGGYNYNGVTGGSLISIDEGGRLDIYEECVLQNNNNKSGGTVIVNGDAYMYNGSVSSNTAVNGGAFEVKATGNLYLRGGQISSNKATLGNGIYNAGNVYRNRLTYYYIQNEAAVASQESDIVMSADNDIYLPDGKTVHVEDASENILLTDDASLPSTSAITAQNITLSPQTYTLGKQIVDGARLSSDYQYFVTAEAGYYLLPNGTLGMNKFVVNSAVSQMKIDRVNEFLSGIDLTNNTAKNIKESFANTNTITITDIFGNTVSDSSLVTTGYTLKLIDSDNATVMDTVTAVVYGDVDCDGSIDGCDALIIAAISAGMLTSDNTAACVLKASDIDANSSTSSTDFDYVSECGVYNETVEQG